MASQVTGYRYFSNFLLFVGNPIEKMLGINFDKRGWLSPFVDKDGKALGEAAINSPSLYGENEGGVAGIVHVQYGTDNQEVLPFYKDYMASQGLPASAYPYQSYLAFTGAGGFNGGGWVGGVIGALMPYNNSAFYLGNSGYMKEMLLWPKRTRVRNDGREQWYKVREDGAIVCEINDRSKPGKIIPIVNQSAILINSSYAELFHGGNLSKVNRDNLEVGYATPLFSYFGENGANHGVHGNLIADARCYCLYTFSLNSLIGAFSIIVTYTAAGDLISTSYKTNMEVFSESVVSSNSGVDQNGASFNETVVEYVVITNGEDGFFQPRLESERAAGGTSAYVRLRIDASPLELEIPAEQTGIDINPIHKIREILTDDTAMNKPESDVNDVNFMKAADCIYDEGLGISWAITEKSCMDAINELCAHIEAGVRINRQTGLYELVLFRDDWFAEDEIHILPQSKIKSLQLEVQNADEAINQLNVSYYNRESIKDSSFSISENAAIKNLHGRVNAEDVKFPYFMNQRNAAVVAQWKLKQLSTPAWSGTFTTGLYEARKWNRYDIVKISWLQKNIIDMPVRIMSISLGSGVNNTVTIDFIEVVPYSSSLSSGVVIDTPIDITPLPPQIALFKAFELSYFEAVQLNGQRAVDDDLAYNPDIGYAAVIAQRPQSNSLNALMYTSAGGEYEKSGVIQYCETAILDQSISRISSSFAVKNAGNISSVRVGSQITVNDETMVYQSFDNATKILTVKRGALDTVPQNHSAGAVLYFADDFVAVDPTEYAVSEIIDVKALTTTPSGVLSLEAPGQKVEITGRAIRPYPPANVKINGEYWPEEIETDFILTWVHRNRVQQTGGEIMGWYDGGVTAEPNTQTHLVLSQLDENNIELATLNVNVTGAASYTMPISSMQANAHSVKITLKTLRDGYECLNPFIHTVELSQFFSAPYDLTVEFKND